MLLLNPLPQRLDTGATPTFAGLLAGDGTAAAPSISFSSDSDTGFFRDSSGLVKFTSNGVAAFGFGAGYFTNGTGTSYLYLPSTGAISLFAAGTNQNITLTPSGTGFVSIPSLNYDLSSASFSAEIKYAGAFSAGRGGSLGLGGTYDGSNSTLFAGIAGVKESAVSGETGGTLTFHSRSNAGAISERARILSTGRFLFGTTTDSGNGILQLATHTTSAGGIGFGTDISLYRTGGSNLAFSAPGSAGFTIYSGSTQGLGLLHDSVNAYITAVTGGILMRTNGGTTALTLDASQNAAFANGLFVQNACGFGIAASNSTYANHAVSTTAASSLRLGHGVAPTSPVNGDMWTTTAGLFIRINGVTKTVTLT